MPDTNYLSMSDEDILNQMPPETQTQPEPETVENPPAQDPVDEEPIEQLPPPSDPEGEEPDDEGNGETGEEGDVQTPAAPAAEEVGNIDPSQGAAVTKEPVPKAEGEGNQTQDPQTPAPKFESTPENHKALYDLLISKPIKANGKEIQLDSPEEVLRLAQMGANYTKKMQQLHPSLRLVKMLDNNGLLDEQKLSHLIDLDKGNPQAIQKFLAEKKFDPNTVDEEEAAKYIPGDHQVTDTELRFSQALDDVESTPEGRLLVKGIAEQWDTESKRELYQDPSILNTLSDHKSLGLYDQIHGEMERQRLLGYIPEGTPFLQAYRATGEFLAKNNRLVNRSAPPQPIATRVVAPPAPQVNNDARARAAGGTRGSTSATPSQTNYLDMPDDEFAKVMAGKL